MNYGTDGELDGANIPFTVGEGQAVLFTFDPSTNLLTIEASDDIPADLANQGSGGGLPRQPPPSRPRRRARHHPIRARLRW
ncbi:MAG: hypothetical protein H6654_17655 [Ardenticatenaceae bacterium]|nr:hypothetical protein [Ardenticatenaceae bacterium]